MLPGEHVVVQKLDVQGRCVVSYDAVVDEMLPSGVLLAARWTRPTLSLGYTTFETGDRFREWFFTDLWYNIFAVASSTGRHKGWYCNIAEPATIQEHTVSSRDLLLDLWVDGDYSMQVLDEDEFTTDRRLTPEDRERAVEALRELRLRVEGRLPPFNSHDDGR
jgi:predicted RNA-binding protein associated with RNAse of E/G family